MARHKPSAIPPDPHWYKDAVVYQLHIKSFFDANNDGIGDFPGLISKLDYLAEIGVNAIWLLPFYPSPLRDDGYDISDYRGVNPEYGTMHDVRRLIEEAHARGLRVITELVVNHTSDQHPWFQRARAAKAGSAARNFYVWSDDDKKYAGTRIIFLDTEKSNWTWDEEAKAYYWHRFYSHQPDLNYDNPRVLKAVLSVMQYWLEMGVDGLRLDAVPYLVEREGTNNENLPETHAILKQMREYVDANFPNRMLIAEANQWPEDIQEYFGAGDECHMAFHFPLMPRMYMAIAEEDRFPITDIMRQTPPIPENCQWAIFLRNHDELTLEMVTDKERDYLWNVYASDRRARLNLGIRRRLAPLMERDRRRIELMNSLLLSMPGTPVIYYGDEIGMGDNIHLGDRDGVRTPMQWSPDRNGGFSRADPGSLALPAIMDPLYGYEAVNVEAQWRDTYSLLNWLRRMLVVRRRHRAFGRGSLRFLTPQNRKVLAYLREFEGETLLCVANVSRTAQAVELELSEFDGCTPVELLGGTAFPRIGQLSYLLTLPPHAFYWFALSIDAEGPPWSIGQPGPAPELRTFVLRNGLLEGIDATARHTLEQDILPAYIANRRWFQGKSAVINTVKIIAMAPVPGSDKDALFADVDVESDEATERYALPMAIAWEDEPTSPFESPLAFARARRNRRVGLLTDGFASARVARALLASLAKAIHTPFGDGEIRFKPVPGATVDVSHEAEIEWPRAEQTNSTLIIGRKTVVKLLRRVTPGVHPEAEMSRVLTERGFTGTAPLLGEITREGPEGFTSALAIVQAFVTNQGDGASWTVDQLARIVDELSVTPGGGGAANFELYEAFARTLGKRVGEMHAILAQPTDIPDFAPETVDAAAVSEWVALAQNQLDSAFAALAALAEDERFGSRVKRLIDVRPRLRIELETLLAHGLGTMRTRIHGDLHLGQVLVATGDVIIIDFEGEPTKTLIQRRAKMSPLRDVAGILRSFDYAAGMAARDSRFAAGGLGEARATALLAEFRQTAERSFLAGYEEGRASPLSEHEHKLITAFALEKAAYEIAYEAANRPDWIELPLTGFEHLAERVLPQVPEASDDA